MTTKFDLKKPKTSLYFMLQNAKCGDVFRYIEPFSVSHECNGQTDRC